ncbi:hypothetical protein PF008_g29565 [Phytophthora fragariae]|uniref:Reverse transcriptase domain-containing protein n=1 Tax=Phytophthora fragariae TaxID=53985 RepID=A0A6G0Q859_9STRA|nr:hypothetical protein PF008_g29565 [Phytophthora fragariae]
MNTPEEIDRLRRMIWKKKHLLIGKGNALPPAARGVVCDIDVGEAKPIAQRVRKIAPQFREKVSDLLKGMLSAKIIQVSRSPWGSPIVVIIKKNGVDIRLCIDYRLVNGLTPLINELLEGLDKVLWYCSLDMASGFWVVSMTDRARAISAFITPFGLFEWNRMPFGLKNAPQIYQRLLDNALYGFTRIPQPGSECSADLIESGEPASPGQPSVLGRRSYIDDILVTAGSWDETCERVEALLESCNQWNLSISVEKSYWGMRKVDYLGHQVSEDGLEAKPKDLSSLRDLPFPSSLRAMQSFLGSLNYYSRFLEDYAVYASTLYELREVDFAELKMRADLRKIWNGMEKGHADCNTGESGGIATNVDPEVKEGRWLHAFRSFWTLREKISATPILRHFDPDRLPVVIVYASEWAISASLMQEHDHTYYPVTFASRTLKLNELNYNVVEKEVLALLRILDLNYNLLGGRPIKVLARHSTLAWLFRSSGLQGRLGQCAALLSPWILEIVKCTKGEDEILGVLAASMTPRSAMDDALVAIAPQKEPRRQIQAPIPTVRADEELLVVSFDGSVRVKRGGGAYSAIVWKLPEWSVVKARSGYAEGLTVNEAEYNGLLLSFDLLDSLDRGRLVICGDSNLVVRQVRGEIDCKAPKLVLLSHKVLDRLRA